MEQTFLTELQIKKVRHLHDITIPLSKTERKNLILTGKNGSGKTSVLEALAEHIELVLDNKYVPVEEFERKIKELEVQTKHSDPEAKNVAFLYWSDIQNIPENDPQYQFYCKWSQNVSYVESEGDEYFNFGTWLRFSPIEKKFTEGTLVVAYYGDSRKLRVTPYTHVEKVRFKPYYEMNERPSEKLAKYLVDLEFSKSFAISRSSSNRATQIESWFTRFENILRRIYDEPSLRLDFNIDTFQFSILIDGREPFDFNTMSMGYAAVFDVVADLMMRMESQRRYDLEGIVLIDEIETHLHVELQKQIVPILTELFPNIQFILTTHSPFILNSAPNAVIYDLEKHMLVKDGMENLSYEGIVESYFGVDRFSQKLRKFFEEYKRLVTSEELTDLDYARISELEDYLDEVPDYLALEFAQEYSRLKAEFDN